MKALLYIRSNIWHNDANLPNKEILDTDLWIRAKLILKPLEFSKVISKVINSN